MKLLQPHIFLFLLGTAITTVLTVIWQMRTPSDFTASEVPLEKIPLPFTFTLQPPALALSAQTTTFSGGVKKNTRTDPTMLPVIGDSTLILIEGEALQTDASGSAELRFDQHVILKISSNTEVTLVHTQPIGFLLRQSRGTITYEQLQDQHSTSIRALNTLIAIPLGKATVAVDPTARSIEITNSTDRLQFAFIDTNNETQLYTLNPGQTAMIDDTSKEVRVENN